MTDDQMPPPMPEVPEPVAQAESQLHAPEGHVIPPEGDWPAEGAPVDEEAAARYDGQ